MGLFNKNTAGGAALSPRQVLDNRYNSARHNLLLLVAFTVINLVLLVTNSNTYFLFSAYVPYFLTDLAMLLCGMYPAEFYTGEWAGMEFLPKGVFAVALVISVVILLVYVLCWIFSKKYRGGWLIAALVFFGLDSLAMLVLNGFDMAQIIDYVFHIWVIVSLVGGISAGAKIKKLPPEQEVTVDQPVTVAPNGGSVLNGSQETAE